MNPETGVKELRRFTIFAKFLVNYEGIGADIPEALVLGIVLQSLALGLPRTIAIMFNHGLAKVSTARFGLYIELLVSYIA
jgi:hypothetical protein